MILQALHQLYIRLAENPANGLPKPGYSLQGISFKVVLHPDGRLHEIQPVKDESGRSVPTIVPGGAKPSGQGINPCFLWDNTGYMLGFKPDDPKPERTAKTFEAFRQKHLELEKEIQSKAFHAVCRFLDSWQPEKGCEHPALVATKTGFGVFQILATPGYVHDDPFIESWWEKQTPLIEEGEKGLCLVTGELSVLAKLHDPAIKGVIGAQSSGAKLVSFNLDAFTSYGKEQSFNAPVSEAAAFAYCTALNHLLASESRRFRVGDTTTVFWTEKPSEAEDLLPFMMDNTREVPEDTTLKVRLQSVMEKIASGKLVGDDLGDAKTRFYILGLAPNASRLSIRFWHTSTLGDLATNLQKHQDDLAIVREWDEMNSKHPDPKVPGHYVLLRHTARDADGIPPLLGGALIRSILLGTPYPDALYQKVMSRVRVAEKDRNGNPTARVPYLRAAIIKAYLNRNHQLHIPMSLDTTRTEPAYLLGRLFAAIEKVQQEALGDVNASIGDRFYSAASATPAAVFSRLLRTHRHHLAKLEGGLRIVREKLVQDINSGLIGFPSHLNLQQQGLFAIGYYHQRKDLFTKRDKTTENTAA